MGATQSRPRETRNGDGEEEIAVAESSSSSALQRHQKRTFRFNVDASQDPHATNKAGIGGVLRNEKGEILRTFSESMELKDDITLAELTAIKRALQVFSKDKFKWVGLYDELTVANDHEPAVNYLQGQVLKPTTKNKDQKSRLLDEIETLRSAIGKVNFINVGRENIRDAHDLANKGRKIVEESANRGILQTVAAGAAVVGLGVAAWSALNKS